MSIPVTGVSELALEVEDLRTAERFYAGVLGLPVVEHWPDREVTWLMAGTRTRIGLWCPQIGGAARGRGGAHVHFALHLPERDFDAAVTRLRAAGLDPEVTQRDKHRRSANRSVYVFDPDGNCVELWTQDVSLFAPLFGQPSLEPPSPEHDEGVARELYSWDDERNLRAYRREARIDTVLRLLGDEPGTVLDLGVRTGRLLSALADRGWNVTGVDSAPPLVELARVRVPVAADRIIVARPENLPFPDGAFDVVVAVGVLEYFDMDAALRELVRVLRPSGRAVIGLRSDRSPTAVWQRSIVHPFARRVKSVAAVGRPMPPPRRRPLAAQDAEALLAAAGLIVEEVEHLGTAIVPDPLDRIAPGLAYRAARWGDGSALRRRIFGTHRVLVARKP
ncbi:MAG: methyltransferase domain-containing protein [Actinomycetota bacterium]|nr:methyltransferase domain-containing protein [Actinomycetota bacterium]